MYRLRQTSGVRFLAQLEEEICCVASPRPVVYGSRPEQLCDKNIDVSPEPMRLGRKLGGRLAGESTDVGVIFRSTVREDLSLDPPAEVELSFTSPAKVSGLFLAGDPRRGTHPTLVEVTLTRGGVTVFSEKFAVGDVLAFLSFGEVFEVDGARVVFLSWNRPCEPRIVELRLSDPTFLLGEDLLGLDFHEETNAVPALALRAKRPVQASGKTAQLFAFERLALESQEVRGVFFRRGSTAHDHTLERVFLADEPRVFEVDGLDCVLLEPPTKNLLPRTHLSQWAVQSEGPFELCGAGGVLVRSSGKVWFSCPVEVEGEWVFSLVFSKNPPRVFLDGEELVASLVQDFEGRKRAWFFGEGPGLLRVCVEGESFLSAPQLEAGRLATTPCEARSEEVLFLSCDVPAPFTVEALVRPFLESEGCVLSADGDGEFKLVWEKERLAFFVGKEEAFSKALTRKEKWYHVALIVEENVRLYVDGALCGSVRAPLSRLARLFLGSDLGEGGWFAGFFGQAAVHSFPKKVKEIRACAKRKVVPKHFATSAYFSPAGLSKRVFVSFEGSGALLGTFFVARDGGEVLAEGVAAALKGKVVSLSGAYNAKELILSLARECGLGVVFHGRAEDVEVALEGTMDALEALKKTVQGAGWTFLCDAAGRLCVFPSLRDVEAEYTLFLADAHRVDLKDLVEYEWFGDVALCGEPVVKVGPEKFLVESHELRFDGVLKQKVVLRRG